MSVEIKVPLLPESVADATMLRWHVKVGQPIRRDENMVDIETEKVVLEVPAPKDGVITQILRNEGDTVLANDVIALFDEGVAANDEKETDGGEGNNEAVNAPPAPAPSKADESEPKGSSSPSNVSAPSPAAGKHQTAKTPKANAKPTASPSGPAAKSAARERGVELAEVKGSGRGGRILKEDVLTHSKSPVAPGASAGERQTRREPMSRLRKTIAGRLLNAQQEAAILTTFNEVDLHEVKSVRARYREAFEKTHGVRLGFMSFFVKACAEALKRFPIINASVDGSDILFHEFYDVGIAVSSPRGLVVPVLRDAERQSLSDIERAINHFGERAREGSLTMDELTGGTFTITNGGVFGSMLSTPILNPPQSAILGMHKIQDRPIALNGEVVIRPMMYLALSYDHRIIDGADAVSFLVSVKEALEDPTRLLLEL